MWLAGSQECLMELEVGESFKWGKDLERGRSVSSMRDGMWRSCCKCSAAQLLMRLGNENYRNRGKG